MIEPLERLARSDGISGHLTKCLLLIVLCLIAFAPGISRLPPVDRDESRYMQATRQMVASGELVDIRFQDQPRYLQPIGIYWLQALAVTVSGKGAAAPAWVFRTVSLIAATIAVLGCYAAGLRLFGPAAGFTAAIALAGIFMLNFEARIAKTDATVLAAAVAMQAALAHVYLGVRQRRAIHRAVPWLFWIAVSLGTIVKGPIVPGLGLLTVAALSIYDRDLSWAKKLRPLAGIAIVILVVAPWLVAITAQSGMTFWKEVLGKSLFGKIQGGQQSHGFPPGYYLVTYALAMWPFAVETLRGGLRALRNLRNDPRVAFCVAWVIPMWIIFELVPTKLPHYVLPLFPSLLILMGWALTDRDAGTTTLGKWEVWLVRAATLGCIVVTSGLAALCIGLLPYLTGEWNVWGIVGAVFVVLAGWLGSGLRPPMPQLPRLLLATLAAVAFTGIFTSSVLPSVKPIWPALRIAEAFEANRLCPGSELAVTGFLEPSVVFAVGTETLLTEGAGAAAHLKADPACAMAAVEARDDPAFQAAFADAGVKPAAVAALSGMNYTTGDRLDFKLYRLPAG